MEVCRVLAIGRRYIFFWQGCNKRTAGVCVIIAERWIYIVSEYAPQVGLSTEEKNAFWDSFIILLSGIPKKDSIFICSDLNGHIGRRADWYGGVHGCMHGLVQETLKARGF